MRLGVIELPMPDPRPESRSKPLTDPFALLELEARFPLEAAAIERAYLARVAACHPDLAGSDPASAARAARLAAALNDARAVLLEPESLARALLARLGWDGENGGGKDLPEGFLMEMMEMRMAVEEAVAGGKSEEMARWREWAREQRRSYIERVGGLFAGLDSPPDRSALEAINRECNAWRYIERMLEQIPGPSTEA